MTTSRPAVELRDVWRRYRVASTRRPRGLRASLSRDPLRRHRDRWTWALRGVDLRVEPGEAVGVVGRNGAGKSTLLRLVGGVGRPDRGTAEVDGRVAALIDLGHELHGDLTGRQNAELAAIVAGLTRREVRRRLADIVDFADLAGVIDEPLRAYSDGMRARLAFSVVINVDPEVLLVDEVLAVGDAAFQRRAIDRLAELRERGAAVVLVSHDLGLVRRVCDRAAWLDLGQIRASGDPAEVVASYLDATGGSPPAAVGSGPERGLIRAVRACDPWGLPTTAVATGEGLVVEIDLVGPVLPVADRPRGQVRVRVLRSATGAPVVDTSAPIGPFAGGSVRVRFDRLDLAPGDHAVEVTAFAADWSEPLAEPTLVHLSISGEGPDTAPLAPPHTWSWDLPPAPRW